MSYLSDPERLERLAMYALAVPMQVTRHEIADTFIDAASRIRESQDREAARRLSDITTPICPDCQGDEWMLEPCPEDPEGAHCGACIDGHIPPKVWVGMLTDALPQILVEFNKTWVFAAEFAHDRQPPPPSLAVLNDLVRLADSVTPKEGT